ncbi:phosphoethanolamine--lipid A transferase [Psychrobacter aestuarii]|uniref:Phosphoethanolamine--lipid A transferase n=2 Tax=Psychrobacter aestuarii TaxID=556327 RepID=A0ABP3FHC8_9GAMM
MRDDMTTQSPWLHKLSPAAHPMRMDTLIMLTALFLVASANISFFAHILAVYNIGDNIGFVLSTAGVLFGLMWLILQLLCYRFSYRVVLVAMVIIAAVCAYFTDTYGTVFDKNMLINGLQTDQAEASDLLAPAFFVRVLLLGIVPAFLIIKTKVELRPWKQAAIAKAVTMLAAVAVVGLCLLPFGDQYASFFRQHKPIRYYTTPITPVYSAFRLGKDSYDDATRPTSMIAHAGDAKKVMQAAASSASKPKLMVFVVGETARADHISLNGYPRDTMPRLAKEDNIYSFKQATACGTSTAYSVPCMFSYLNQADYDIDTADYNENVLDTLQRLGVTVIWRDNNSSSKGVADRVSYTDFKEPKTNPVCDVECRDVGMLTGMDKMVDTKAPKDTLIVLHQMGNHGPAYYKRYPSNFTHFTPVCESNELSQCDQQAVINGYDNALRYTDDFLAQTIDALKPYADKYDVMMVYMSDHGESLGENNIYLHGLPYQIAPDTQKHVPLIIWSPENNGIDSARLQAQTTQPISHDAITPSLLTFFDIQTKETAGAQTMFTYK